MTLCSRKVLATLAMTWLIGLSGCASWVPSSGPKQVGSVVDYLYPDAKEAPKMATEMVVLRPPIRVGIAFVPGNASAISLPEQEKTRLLERVKSSFAHHNFIGSIEVIPSSYMRPRGGFANLDQVARLFNVDVVALMSYDQVQFNDTNALSMLYWTIVGAYVIKGDQYDIQTLVDASVFDVKSRKLLFRAPGSSQVKGSATMAGFSEQSRAARAQGYQQAVDNLIPQLQSELERFRERIKTDATVQVQNRPGYKGGGSLGPWALLGLGLMWAASAGLLRRRSAPSPAHVSLSPPPETH